MLHFCRTRPLNFNSCPLFRHNHFPRFICFFPIHGLSFGVLYFGEKERTFWGRRQRGDCRRPFFCFARPPKLPILH